MCPLGIVMKRSLFAHRQFWHLIFWVLALLASTPLLWPRMLPRAWRGAAPHVCGYVIIVAVLLSVIVLCVSCVRLLARLRNLRTLGEIILCGLQWLTASGLFAVLAYVADVEPPKVEVLTEQKEEKPPVVQEKKEPPIPSDVIHSPWALVIPINPDSVAESDTHVLCNPTHLVDLEKEHPDILDAYITESPRWKHSKDDLHFFSKPWHVVLPVKESKASVHAAFISISVGQQVPSEYKIVKAGETPPTAEQEGGRQLPDLALELGGTHYLLLAWRGPADPGGSLRAINAAVHEIDKMVEMLAKTPTQDSLKALTHGDNEKRPVEGSESAILVSEPYSHSGLYQAQILANPGRRGSLVVEVVDSETQKILRRFEFPAHFSHHSRELFCYDIPGDLPRYTRQSLIAEKVIPANDAPLFAIRRTAVHRESTPPARPVVAPDAGAATKRTGGASDKGPVGEEDKEDAQRPFDVIFKLSFKAAGREKLELITSETFRVIPAADQKESPLPSQSAAPPRNPHLSRDTSRKQPQCRSSLH